METTVTIIEPAVLGSGVPGVEMAVCPHYEDLGPPCSDDVKGPVVLFVDQRHDGTCLFTDEAISAVMEAGRQLAARRGGSWQASPVRILSRMERGDMPYGKARTHLREFVAMAMAEVPA